MTYRTTIASLLAAGALVGVANARSDQNERARYLFEDLISMVGEGNAEVSDKIRLALLYRQAGAMEDSNRLLVEAADEYPELNSLLNPKAMPEFEAMIRDASQLDIAGADVIVGDLNGSGPGNYTSAANVGGICAFSIGTTSCNLGTVPLEWIENSARHPVIAQNFFRLKNGRFEQIGMSWLKHGFCALQENICGSCSPYGGCCCDHLGLLCSDPYTASLNGGQTRLGPRSEVNAATGVYPWPHYLRSQTGNAIFKRLQVRADDLNPALNPAGTLYFGEGQYVALDDAIAGNKNNNASYRRFTYNWSTGGNTVSTISWSGTTQRQKPAIQAWQDNDPTVTIVNVDVPGDGRFIVGYKVTDNGNGTWSYEYAIQNLNSNRAGQSFSVPAPGAVLSNIGFHDVDYHSGDGTPNGSTQDGTDWSAVEAGGAVTWATLTEGVNPNANALEWSTLYNFRFTANRAPVAATATLGLFRGGAGSVSVAVQGPACLLAGDIDGNGTVNFADLNLVLANFGTQYTFQDLNNVLASFGLSC